MNQQDYSITFKTDGRIVEETEIRKVERDRTIKVLHELLDKGVALSQDGGSVTASDFETLPLSDLKELLAATKERLGREEIRRLYAKELEDADKMWKEIYQAGDPKNKLQQAIVEVTTKNISLKQFLMFNRSLAEKNNLYLPSLIHPEHYSFEAGKGGTQTIIETFGMYGNPSWLYLVPAKKDFCPIAPDPDTVMVMCGQVFLASDKSDTGIIGMHQFKDRPDGLSVKLGMFLPSAAPKEIVEGHKWHFLVEFNNGLHEAAKQHPHGVQDKMLDLAIAKMKKKNQG